MKLSTLVIIFAISLLITSPQIERLSALAATTESGSVPQRTTTTKEPEPTSQVQASTTQSAQTRQESKTQQPTETPTQQEESSSPPSQKTNEPAKSDAPTSVADVTTPPPITITSTSTIPRLSGTGSPVPGNPNSSGNNSSSSQPQIEVPASTTKTIVIAAGVVGAIVVLGGISIVLYRYQKSRTSDFDEDSEVVLRDGYGAYSGNPFQSTLDQYHRHR